MEHYGILRHKASGEVFAARFSTESGKMTGAHGPIRPDRPDSQLQFFPYTKGIAAFISDHFDEYCLIRLTGEDVKYPLLTNPRPNALALGGPLRFFSPDSPTPHRDMMN